MGRGSGASRRLAERLLVPLTASGSLGRGRRSRVAVADDDAATVRGHVDAPVHARVAGDGLTREAELMRIVVDALPGRAPVIRLEDAAHAVDLRAAEQRELGLARRRLAEA